MSTRIERPVPSFDDTAIAFSGLSDRQLRKAHWLFRLMGNPTIVDVGAHFTKLAFQVGLPVKNLVKYTIYNHFCGGESLEETRQTVDRLANHGVSTILDYGVEAKESEEEFDRVTAEQVAAIGFANGDPNVPYISCKVTAYAPFRLLRKLHEKEELTGTELDEHRRLRERLDRICRKAVVSDVAVYIDAEESWIQDAVDELAEALMARYNRDEASVFTTAQMYRHDRLDYLRRLHARASSEGWIPGVKLVRGAYMEKERERARRKSCPSPIQPDKAATDRDFDAALDFCLDRVDEIACCAATHNESSCRRFAEGALARGIVPDHPHIHFAQLYGMSDHISFNLARAGFNASKYVPYGPVRDVIPYLIRRAEENSSVAGQMSRELGLIKEEMRRRRLT